MAKKDDEAVTKGISILGSFIEAIVFHADKKVHEVKRKAVQVVIVYGVFLAGLLFMAIGLIKYLAFVIDVHEGLVLALSGFLLIFFVMAYSFFNKV